MEAVARQFISDEKKCLIIRNGLFSYRWTQIIDAGRLTSHSTVLKARRSQDGPREPFSPPPLEEVISAISSLKPSVVIAPHVETSAGLIIPDDYIRAVAQAAHDNGGIFVLDCIASGCIWVDMRGLGVDVLVSAPQKGLE
jgi:aspartate aminotransferase-like enzyme